MGGSPSDGNRPSALEASDVASLAVLTLVWGSTWAAIRVSLAGIPPFAGMAIRFLAAGAILLVVARWRGVALGRTAIERRLWAWNALTTFLVPYGTIYWAEQWVPTGLASILFSTFPLWVVALGRWLLPEERLDVRRTMGVVLGFVGVGVVFSEDFTRLGGAGVRWPATALLGAAAVSASGTLALRRWGRSISPLSLASVPMLATGAAAGILAAFWERHRGLTAAPWPWVATAYLAIFGSAVTFTLYFRLLSRRGAVLASMVSYTAPVVAVGVGILAFDEPVTGRVIGGAALVLAGVALVLRPSRPAPSPGD